MAAARPGGRWFDPSPSSPMPRESDWALSVAIQRTSKVENGQQEKIHLFSPHSQETIIAHIVQYGPEYHYVSRGPTLEGLTRSMLVIP